MRRIALAAVLVAMVSLGACGNGSQNTATNAPTTAASNGSSSTVSAAPANLQGQLLTLSDFPAGWSIDNSANNDSGSTPACFKGLKDTSQTKDHATASFKNGSNLPNFSEGLQYYPGGAKPRMARLAKALGSCGQIKFTSGGHSFTGTVGQLSFPPVGDQTEAYQVALSSPVGSLNLTIGLDLVAVRKGSTIIGMIYVDLGTPAITEAEQLVNKASAKVAAS